MSRESSTRAPLGAGEEVGMKSFVRALVAALFVLVVPAGSGVRGADAAEDMTSMISGSKSAADHEALAEHYEHEAAAAKAKAEEHKSMAAAYRKAVGPASKAQLPEHCDGLVVQYEAAASKYAEMAKLHRELAKGVK